MNNKKPYYTIIFIGVICLMTACITKPEPKTTENNICIPPFTEFSYYAGQGTPYPEKSVVPPTPWTMEATIELQTPVLLGVRTLPNNVNELWFLERFTLGSEKNAQNQVYSFRTDEAELKPVVLNEAFLSSLFPINDIYITNDNSIWTTDFTNSYSKNPILGKYDEINNEILPVVKLFNISHHSSLPTLVLIDQNSDLFWFLVPYGYIYSYDPITDTLEKHISIGEKEIGGAAVTSNGKIYIYALRFEHTSDGAGDALFLYSPTDGTLEQVTYYLERNYQPMSLYIDQDERLWMGSNGWMEPDGTWYQTVSSPLFVQATGELVGNRFDHWFPPDIKFETSDGLLWFTGRGGTYSLDFENGEWCWVSTFSEIVMDNDGNLWMLADGNLYYYEINP